MSVTFALGIPHTPWRPERRHSFLRLLGQLGEETELAPKVGEWKVFSDREPNYAWSAKLWSWACETNATHLLQLQDDAIVAPEFWGHLCAMVGTVPDAVIGLEAAHPKGAEVEGCWYTTADMLIGVGYVAPVSLLREFLAWRAKLRKGAIESVSEDTLLGVWCLSTDRRIWHPVPTIIDHDTDLPSTYGNDEHGHRRPPVTWREKPLPRDWTLLRSLKWGTAISCDIIRMTPYLGRFYEATPRLAKRWIVDATEEDYQRWLTQ